MPSSTALRCTVSSGRRSIANTTRGQLGVHRHRDHVQVDLYGHEHAPARRVGNHIAQQVRDVPGPHFGVRGAGIGREASPCSLVANSPQLHGGLSLVSVCRTHASGRRGPRTRCLRPGRRKLVLHTTAVGAGAARAAACRSAPASRWPCSFPGRAASPAAVQTVSCAPATRAGPTPGTPPSVAG